MRLIDRLEWNRQRTSSRGDTQRAEQGEESDAREGDDNDRINRCGGGFFNQVTHLRRMRLRASVGPP